MRLLLCIVVPLVCHSQPLEGLLPRCQSVILKLQWSPTASAAFLSVAFIWCVYIHTNKKQIGTSPKPCPKSIHKSLQLSWWKGSVNQVHVLASQLRVGSSRRMAWSCMRVAGKTHVLLGRLVHFSSYWISCCGSLLPRMVTASKNAFTAMAAGLGFECSWC